MKVRNMTNKNGREVPNQFIIDGAIIKVPKQGAVSEILVERFGTAFQSYDSIIAFQCQGRTWLDHNMWDYSTTTGKYRNQFLGETKKETQTKIDSGEYILTDLN